MFESVNAMLSGRMRIAAIHAKRLSTVKTMLSHTQPEVSPVGSSQASAGGAGAKCVAPTLSSTSAVVPSSAHRSTCENGFRSQERLASGGFGIEGA